MIRLNDITSIILSYNPNANINLIEKAYVFLPRFIKGKYDCLENLICPTL